MSAARASAGTRRNESINGLPRARPPFVGRRSPSSGRPRGCRRKLPSEERCGLFMGRPTATGRPPLMPKVPLSNSLSPSLAARRIMRVRERESEFGATQVLPSRGKAAAVFRRAPFLCEFRDSPLWNSQIGNRTNRMKTL